MQNAIVELSSEKCIELKLHHIPTAGDILNVPGDIDEVGNYKVTSVTYQVEPPPGKWFRFRRVTVVIIRTEKL